jgi:hypothetical protein
LKLAFGADRRFLVFFGVNWIDLLLGRLFGWLFGGDGVCREILSFESTLSASIGTRPLAAKQF